MPTHHACHACGLDLSRLRAFPEPHYGLPLVTCPGCAACVVRRRDPGLAGWRRARRSVRALVAVAVQCVMWVLVLAAAYALIDGVAETAYLQHGSNPLAVLVLLPHELHPDASGPMLGVLSCMLLMLGVFTGVWIRSAMAHLPALKVWAVAGALGGMLAVAPGLIAVAWYRIQPNGHPWGDPSAARYLGGTLTATIMYAALIPAGFPFGRIARAAWRANWKARRSKYRRRRRRLREDR